MVISKSLKWKVDAENWSFNEEWTDKYVFIVPTFAVPLCLFAMKLCLSDIRGNGAGKLCGGLPVDWNKEMHRKSNFTNKKLDLVY